MTNEPRWESVPDDELVERSGLAAVRSVPGGLAQPHPHGFQAQAELVRRLAVELRETRTELSKSGLVIKRLTWVLVALTAIIAVLTAVLVFEG